MSNTSVGLIFKVMVSSAVLAAAIKYGGPYVALPPTAAMALVLVLLPCVVMAAFLGWRSWQQGRSPE